VASVKKTGDKKEVQVLRDKQIGDLDIAIQNLSAKIRALKETERRVDILEDVSLGLYEELDKLAKKAPADQVTNLVLEQTNEVIHEAKELLSEDPFIKRYKEFVAAGDNPEHRDVVVVLLQIRQGLGRFTSGVEERKDWLDRVLEDAKGVRAAAILSRDGESDLSQEELSEYDGKIMSRWFNDSNVFDFERLDQTSIGTYYDI
jgi:hypothetical protein